MGQRSVFARAKRSGGGGGEGDRVYNLKISTSA